MKIIIFLYYLTYKMVVGANFKSDIRVFPFCIVSISDFPGFTVKQMSNTFIVFNF